MDERFPSPTLPVDSRAGVFLGYLDYFRAQIIAKTGGLIEDERRGSRLPSGWTPLELVKHLTFVELRWLEWGFDGRQVDEPWGDQRGDRWCVTPEETTEDLLASLQAQAVRSRAIVEDNDLASVGRPGPRWDGAQPPTLERVLFHLLQDYARHLGHLDVVAELSGGPVGEQRIERECEQLAAGPRSSAEIAVTVRRGSGTGRRPRGCARRTPSR